MGRSPIVACLIGESEKNVNEGEKGPRAGAAQAGIAARSPAIQFISPTRKEIGDMTR